MTSDKPEISSQKSEDAGLEFLIKEGLGRKLDTQRGRAGAAFQRAVMDEERGMRNTEWRRLKIWTAGALALAACLAVAAMLQFLGRNGGAASEDVNVVQAEPRPQPQASPPPALPLGIPVNRVDYSRDVDAGTVVMNNVPMRVVRHQTLRRTEWVDPADKATYSVTEPGEQVGYVRLQPN